MEFIFFRGVCFHVFYFHHNVLFMSSPYIRLSVTFLWSFFVYFRSNKAKCCVIFFFTLFEILPQTQALILLDRWRMRANKFYVYPEIKLSSLSLLPRSIWKIFWTFKMLQRSKTQPRTNNKQSVHHYPVLEGVYLHL